MSNFIDKQTVLTATNNGLEIIKLYYPEADASKPKKKFKVRPEDDASASIIFKDIWFIKDFGDSDKAINPIQLVMNEEGLEFNQALNFIVDRLNLDIPHTPQQIYKPGIQKKLLPQDNYTWEIKEFTNADLQELGKKVDVKLCERFHLHSLASYTNKNGTIFSSNENYPIYLWDFGEWQKLYQPRADKQYRFMYFGTKPKDFIYGFKQCKDFILAQSKKDDTKDDEKDFEPINMILKASGDRDALNLASDGYQVIWTDSEAVLLSYNQHKEIMRYCKQLYNIPDIDAPGIRYAQELALRFLDLRTVFLPESLKCFRDHRGNACKDFTDFVNHLNNPFTYLKKLLKAAFPIKFWEEYWNPKQQRKEIHFFNSRFYEFLKFNGFYRFSVPNTKEGYIFIQVKNKIVTQIKPTIIRNFIDRYLKENHFPEHIRDGVYRTNQISDNSLSHIDLTELDFTSYGREFQYMFFKNCAWKVTKDGIHQCRLGDFDNYVWDYSLQDPHVKKTEPLFKVNYSDKYSKLLIAQVKTKSPEKKENLQTEISSFEDYEKYDIKINDKDFSFLKFLQNTAKIYWKQEEAGEKLSEKQKGIQDLHLINRLYTLGYLLHKFKDPSRPWSVFAMDISDVEFGRHEGGSGKSLVYKSIRKLLKTVTLDGMDKNLTDYPHIYELVTELTDFILIDDCSPFLNLKFFFAKQTGELTVNPKRTTQFEIPFKHVPKFAFTLNGALKNLDGSTKRRIIFTAFSDYYHEKDINGYYESTRTPATEFGKNLIDDYDDKEMNSLYNLFANCISLYLQFDKIDPPMDDIQKRNYRLDMGETFLAWAEEYFMNIEHCNTYLGKKELYAEFQESVGWKDNLSQFEKRKYKETNFKRLLGIYARYINLEFNPVDIDGYDEKNSRIMRKVDGKTLEYIYMRRSNNYGRDPKDNLPF